MKRIDTTQLSLVGLSHDPKILKKVFIRNGEIPNLTNFSVSIFKPGQRVGFHSHPTMYEVFLVQTGRMAFNVEGENFALGAGEVLILEPGERHAMENRSKVEVTLLYFGIATHPLP